MTHLSLQIACRFVRMQILTQANVIRWVQGDDIIAQKPKWIPEVLFNLDFRWSRDRKTPFLSSSNGLASGNTREEAILHGLCEVIERDQTSFWLIEQKTGRSRASTRVRLETIDNKSNRQLIWQCQRSGLEIFVWYMTTTVEVPAFCCVIADEKHRTWYPQRASGFGCHPKKDIALSRAITEALQTASPISLVYATMRIGRATRAILGAI